MNGKLFHNKLCYKEVPLYVKHKETDEKVLSLLYMNHARNHLLTQCKASR